MSTHPMYDQIMKMAKESGIELKEFKASCMSNEDLLGLPTIIKNVQKGDKMVKLNTRLVMEMADMEGLAETIQDLVLPQDLEDPRLAELFAKCKPLLEEINDILNEEFLAEVDCK